MALLRHEAERQAERPHLPREALTLLRGAMEAAEAEPPADPTKGRPARLRLDVPLSRSRVPRTVRREDVRAGALVDHAALRWPDGAPRRCKVLEVDRERVTWAPLRRDEFPWQVGRWLGGSAQARNSAQATRRKAMAASER